MITRRLRVLQLNIMKLRAGMEALINDPQTKNLDILLIREPSVTAYRTHVNRRLWQLYQPTYTEEGTRKRSLLDVHKRISTSAHRQIHCNSPDVTVVKIWTDEIQILVFSIYISPITYHQLSQEVTMKSTLDEIRTTIQDATRDTVKPSKVILAGYFNRHHPAWSGNGVHHQIMRHAEELLTFIHNQGLQWCLPRGTPTFWSLTHPGKTSTIDLTLTDSPERILYSLMTVANTIYRRDLSCKYVFQKLDGEL